ncbi:MAG: efflux RND transporter permease subunit [Gemmataceae bacterium]
MRSFALLFLFAFAQATYGQSPLLIEVRAPGFASRTVEQIVLTPIEQQLRRLESVRRLRGLALDGRCLIRLDLAKDADPELVRLVVRNRMALARTKLPPSCSAEILPPVDDAFMLVSSVSPGIREVSDSSQLMKELVWPVLADVPGVAHIQAVGATDDKIYLLLDPHKLTQNKLSAWEVFGAIQDSLKNGEEFIVQGERVAMKKTERLPDLIKNIPLKSRENVRLRDVASIFTDVAREDCRITLRKGKELTTRRGVFLLVHLAPGKLNPVAQKGLEKALRNPRLATKPPDGVLCERQLLSADTTTVVMRFPGTKYLSQPAKKAQEAVNAMLELPQVRKVFSLVQPADNEAVCWVMADPGKKADLSKALRAKLARIKGVNSRVGELYSPFFPWPSEGASLVVRLQGKNFVNLQRVAELLCKRLRKTTGIVDVDRFPKMRKMATIEVDREKAAAAGVTMLDVNRALAAPSINKMAFPVLGGPKRLTVEWPPFMGGELKDLVEILEIQGIEYVNPLVNLLLRDVAKVSMTSAPSGNIPHEDGRRCVLITANLEGRNQKEARADIQRLALDLAEEGVHIDVE